jgi:hypothetical protein
VCVSVWGGREGGGSDDFLKKEIVIIS